MQILQVLKDLGELSSEGDNISEKESAESLLWQLYKGYITVI